MRKFLLSLSLFLASVLHGEITSVATPPGGSSGQVQYNSSKRFGGSSNFTFNGTTVSVTGLSASTMSVTQLSMTTMTATYGTIGTSLTWPGGYSTKSRPGYVNVKDYGATGDGTTNDTAAVAAAFDAVGSGVLYFPRGDYKFSLNIGDDFVSIMGEDGGTRFFNVSTSTYILAFKGTGNPGRRFVRNVKFTSITGSFSGRALYINVQGYISVHNCSFEGFEYGVYLNSSNWDHFNDCTFSQNTYGVYSTTVNGDIFGFNPSFGQNSATQNFVQCQFLSNTIAFYNDTINDPFIDEMHANSFYNCDFLSNGLAIAAPDNGGQQWQSLLLSYIWLEGQTRTGTITVGSHVMNKGDIYFSGGSIYLANVFSDGAPFNFLGQSYIKGHDLHLSGNAVNISSNSLMNIDGLVNDTNGGSTIDAMVSGLLPAALNGRSTMARVPNKTTYVLNMSSANVITSGTSTGAFGSLPTTAAGSPTKSFIFGDGFFANRCVKIVGASSDAIQWQASLSTGSYYVTSFAIKADTATGSFTLRVGQTGTPDFIGTGDITLGTSWRTYASIGGTSATGTGTFSLTQSQTATYYISNVQVVEFKSLADAENFYNSNAFVLKTSEISNRQYADTTAPASGTWAVGDVVWNTAPSSGGLIGFVCTVAGTPGTWVSFGPVGVTAIANGGTNSSTALSGSSIMISNGTAIIQGSAGTTTTLLHGNASGAPTYSAVSLSADVTGTLSGSSVSGGTFGAVNGSALTSLTAKNVVGTATNDSATAGNIGEVIESKITTFATDFPATGVYGDFTSISLTAGDWSVSFQLEGTPVGGTTTIADYEIGISITSGNSSSGLLVGDNDMTTVPFAASSATITISNHHMQLSGTTTVYAKYLADYTGSAPRGRGRITAIRIR